MNGVKSSSPESTSTGAVSGTPASEPLGTGLMPETISALARAMFSRLPSIPICEVPTLVITASEGSAHAARRSISPRAFMPISSTSTCVSRGALKIESGKPIRLL